jgi:hypothetical protein
MFVTQKRSYSYQLTANQKNGKGKPNSDLKHPPFSLGFKQWIEQI